MKLLTCSLIVSLLAVAFNIVLAAKPARPQPVLRYTPEAEFATRVTALGVTPYRTSFECLDEGTPGPLAFTKGGNAVSITGDFVVESIDGTNFLVLTANCLSDDAAPVTTTFGTAVAGVMFGHTPGATLCCLDNLSPPREFCSPANPFAVSSGFAGVDIQSCTILFGSMSSVSFFAAP